MTSPPKDPRVFYAAERTLLAWIRTGLSVIGMGFVVARFEMNLRSLHSGPVLPPHPGATAIGFCLVVMGSVSMAVAARQHWRFCKTLGPEDWPSSNLIEWSYWYAVVLSVIGVILSVYILVRSFGG